MLTYPQVIMPCVPSIPRVLLIAVFLWAVSLISGVVIGDGTGDRLLSIGSSLLTMIGFYVGVTRQGSRRSPGPSGA